ncbi:MAG: hypothetical protein AW07_03808 [Candidatus Accumulibacter sp. SK-11]|nr:MAG: hypothetical protein AW07_03808 [Candidatus Accumulibacter sp. SK-11]
MASQIEFRGGNRHQAAAPERFEQREARNAADAETVFDGPLDRFGVLEFEPDLQVRAMIVQRPVKRLAGTGTGLADDPRLLHQLGDRRTALLCQRVSGRTEDHQFVCHPWLDNQVGMAATPLHQPQIEFVLRQLLDDAGRVLHLQLHAALRVPAQKLGDDQRCKVVADRQRRADAQPAVTSAALEDAVDGRCPFEQLDGLRQ